MVESRYGSGDLTEASKKNLATEKFFVSAEDQVQITDPSSNTRWKVNIVKSRPFVVGVNKFVDDEMEILGKPKALVPNKLYQLTGSRMYIMTTIRTGDSKRTLRLFGPEGTDFKLNPEAEVNGKTSKELLQD